MPSALKIVRRFGRKPTQADCEGHEKTNRIGEIYIETIRKVRQNTLQELREILKNRLFPF